MNTPGPWKADDYGVMHWASPGEPQGDIEVCIVSLDNPNREADTRLIAAAPDLLAALSEFVSSGHDAGAPEWKLKLFERARAAIAKATGGES